MNVRDLAARMETWRGQRATLEAWADGAGVNLTHCLGAINDDPLVVHYERPSEKGATRYHIVLDQSDTPDQVSAKARDTGSHFCDGPYPPYDGTDAPGPSWASAAEVESFRRDLAMRGTDIEL